MPNTPQQGSTKLSLIQEDPAPGQKVLVAGDWSIEKLELLRGYVHASWGARNKWPNRCYVDLFCGPGRIKVRSTETEVDGGAVAAWRQSSVLDGAFTRVLIGDVDRESLESCAMRLNKLGANVTSFCGTAETNVQSVMEHLPQNGLHLAFLDPFNMGHLPFSVLECLCRLKAIDLVVHFSVMDLQREIELDFERDESRFEVFAPGWKQHVPVTRLTKREARDRYVAYWLSLLEKVGFRSSKEMPLITNSNNGPLYRMIFIMRHKLAERLWSDVSKGSSPNRDLF